MNYLYYNDTQSFLNDYENIDFAGLLSRNYRELYSSDPGVFLYNSWKGSIGYLHKIINDLDKKGIVLEYIIPAGGERADAILIGKAEKPSLIVIEMKGWRHMENTESDYFVRADGKREVNPVYQVLNYEGKIKYGVENADRFFTDSLVILYNMDEHKMQHEKIYFRNNEKCLVDKLRKNLDPGFDERTASLFINGRYIQNKNLFDAVRSYYNDIKDGAMNALASKGYGLYSEQLEPYEGIIDDLQNGISRNYVIHGGPGSGKTLMAINLLLRSETMEKQSVLAYRNNRMVESLRKMLDGLNPGLSTMIKYYSTGRPGNPGIADDGFTVKYNIAIFDEAQRMTVRNIQNAGNVADISVFFYDDSQILGRREQGMAENFRKYLDNPVEIELKGMYRNGNEYGQFVNDLLGGQPSHPDMTYEFKYFSDIGKMIDELRKMVGRNRKSALVASFTEAKGDLKNSDSMDNLRVGYPLSSGFDLYKNTSIRIRWLMNPKKDYAPFWVGGESNKLDRCASVYGAQGFEADYTGVIWGRDLVWRGGKWVLGDNCEDFEIKKSFYSGKNGNRDSYNTAISLLINRYRILLTRGIHGTYIFCEDGETGKYLHSLIEQTN